MRKIVLVILAVLICAPVFAKHQKRKKKKKQSQTAITSVAMHRTPCYGRCPDYSIKISSNGEVVYTGMRFVEDSGVYTKNIGTEKAMEIINQFITNRVDTCKDLYSNRIPDLPGIVMTIVYNGKTKEIRNAHFGPPYLKGLATSMDEVGKQHDNSWKKK